MFSERMVVKECWLTVLPSERRFVSSCQLLDALVGNPHSLLFRFRQPDSFELGPESLGVAELAIRLFFLPRSLQARSGGRCEWWPDCNRRLEVLKLSSRVWFVMRMVRLCHRRVIPGPREDEDDRHRAGCPFPPPLRLVVTEDLEDVTSGFEFQSS